MTIDRFTRGLGAAVILVSATRCDRLLNRGETQAQQDAAAVAPRSSGAKPAASAPKSPDDVRAAALGKLPAHVKTLREAKSSEKCPAGTKLVPGATFMMGREKMSPVDDRVAEEALVPEKMEMENEVPAHRVTVGGFCIDTVPVALVEYATCVDRGRCSPARFGINGPDGDCDKPRSEAIDHAIECVDQGQASAYCRAIGGRLPEEKEWELAARGTDGRTFPWGTPTIGRFERYLMPPRACKAMGPDDPQGCGVGRFPEGASPYGVLDMAGTHAEWTASRFCDYAKPSDCDDKFFAVRSDYRQTLRSRTPARRAGAGDSVQPFLGFRCAFDLIRP